MNWKLFKKPFENVFFLFLAFVFLMFGNYIMVSHFLANGWPLWIYQWIYVIIILVIGLVYSYMHHKNNSSQDLKEGYKSKKL